mmetsp:Transcript_18922/g.35896  ORF Transcript_18922/g.35896 Transcript_18922/m.35896 type:complete len:216 (-) Transcript_18922:692-1339(-)
MSRTPPWRLPSASWRDPSDDSSGSSAALPRVIDARISNDTAWTTECVMSHPRPRPRRGRAGNRARTRVPTCWERDNPRVHPSNVRAMSSSSSFPRRVLLLRLILPSWCLGSTSTPKCSTCKTWVTGSWSTHCTFLARPTFHDWPCRLLHRFLGVWVCDAKSRRVGACWIPFRTTALLRKRSDLPTCLPHHTQTNRTKKNPCLRKCGDHVFSRISQ